MWLHIKTLLEKIIKQWEYPSLLYPQSYTSAFPEVPESKLRVAARLRGVKSELRHRNVAYNLGSLYTLPHPFAVKAYRDFLDQNPNHLGNWLDKAPHYATQQLEYEVIQKMIHLYKAKDERLEGYITTGGTEGNIFSVWLGRSYLKQYCDKDTICLLRTNLTHYSVDKAGRICDIEQHIIPLNIASWGMHPDGLRSVVKDLYLKGKRGFLLPLTIGYTSTGTTDNILEITKTVELLQRECNGSRFFLWIDAALNGLITPFISDFQPFSSPLIQTCIVDFHKFGQVPYPAGILFYRKNLRKLIEQPIDYLKETDSTLLGSRTGIPAVSIWAMMQYLGKQGYKQIVREQRKNRDYFIDQLKQTLPTTEIVTDKNSLSCGVIFHSLKNQRLPKSTEDKYWLYVGKTTLIFYPNKTIEPKIYKVFFLPHITKAVIGAFINEITLLHES